MHISSQGRAALLAACLLLIPGIQYSYATAAPRAGTGLYSTIRNIRVSQNGFADYAEPALAVNPHNSLNLLGAAMDFDRSSTPGTFVSHDGGRTWHDNGALALPAGFTQGGDVSVAFNAQGTGFVAAQLISGLNADVRGVFVWRTDDGGQTFRRPVGVVSGTFVDHPWMAVDTTTGAGAGNLYVAWATRSRFGHTQSEGLAFSRSTNGGHSFATPRIISAPQGGITAPVLAAGPAGAVYVAYVTAKNAPAGQNARAVSPASTIDVMRSADAGMHFARSSLDGPAIFGLTPADGLLVPTGPSLATDPRDGTVYVAYVADHPGTSQASGIVLSRSQAGGRSWGHPVQVTSNRRAGHAVDFQPRVAVSVSGTVAVSYDTMEHGHVDVALVQSTRHGASFGPSTRVTSVSFDPALGLPGGKEGLWWIGDYQGLAVGPRAFYPFWSDTRTGHLEIFSAAVSETAAR
ncbi:MAG: hypothetical protein JWO59_386 [Chloroflexi bacterium]|nr:hypothetical protein [Chloroflexota bacterium]